MRGSPGRSPSARSSPAPLGPGGRAGQPAPSRAGAVPPLPSGREPRRSGASLGPLRRALSGVAVHGSSRSSGLPTAHAAHRPPLTQALLAPPLVAPPPGRGPGADWLWSVPGRAAIGPGSLEAKGRDCGPPRFP